MSELTRKISLEGDFMSIETDDLLYGWIVGQTTCNIVKNKIYVPVSKIRTRDNKKYLEKLLDKSWRTIDRHIDSLISKGLISYEEMELNGNKEQVYVMNYNCKRYQIVNMDLLKFLVDTSSKNVIKIFVYLLNKYLWKKTTGEYYSFTKRELIIKALGYEDSCGGKKELLATVNNCLYAMTKIGFITYEEYYEDINGNGVPKMRLLFVAEKAPNRN